MIIERGLRWWLSRVMAVALIIVGLTNAMTLAAQENDTLVVAQFNQQGQLLKPIDLDHWIHLGSNLGHGYNAENFDPQSPGTFQVVEMEPNAFDFFREHGRYADGTMIALSFYWAEAKSNPSLNGFSQGQLVGFEIHLIDSQHYNDGRAFFNFGLEDRADMIAAGNQCVECHRQEGAFESTFTQFYPKMKKILQLHQQSISGLREGVRLQQGLEIGPNVFQ